MNTPESLREFTNELVRRGLPMEYSRRAAEELADHQHDILEELQVAGMDEASAIATASERLGDSKSLLKKTVREFQRRHWCGRWPVMTFALGPMALLFVAWVGSSFFLVGIGKLCEALGMQMPNSSHELGSLGLAILYFVVIWFLLAIPAAVVLFLSRLAMRSGVNLAWLVISSALLALMVGSVRTGFVPSPETVEHPFMITIPAFWLLSTPSLGEIASWYLHTTWQMTQVFVPLLTAVILVWRKSVQRQRMSLTV
jgi:hypothetical protein